MTPGEDGLITLRDFGRLPPDVGAFEEPVPTWDKLLQCIEWMRKNNHDRKTLVIDVLNGCENLCRDYVCERKFGGNYQDYVSYGKGPDEMAKNHWPKLFVALDALRREKNIAIILLAHAKRRTVNNPFGDNYDAFEPDISEKCWQAPSRWADALVFLHNEPITDAKKRKSTGLAGRKFYCCEHPVYVAKNRLGLPAEIDVPEDYTQTFAAFYNAVKVVRAEADERMRLERVAADELAKKKTQQPEPAIVGTSSPTIVLTESNEQNQSFEEAAAEIIDRDKQMQEEFFDNNQST